MIARCDRAGSCGVEPTSEPDGETRSSHHSSLSPAMIEAERETGLAESTFPTLCPTSLSPKSGMMPLGRKSPHRMQFVFHRILRGLDAWLGGRWSRRFSLACGRRAECNAAIPGRAFSKSMHGRSPAPPVALRSRKRVLIMQCDTLRAIARPWVHSTDPRT